MRNTDLHAETLGDLLVLKPIGPLDACTGRWFSDRLAPLMDQSRQVLVNLSRVDLIDSSGLAVLLTLVRQAASTGRTVKLCAPSRSVRTVLELVRMNRVVDIVDDEEKARQLFLDGTSPLPPLAPRSKAP